MTIVLADSARNNVMDIKRLPVVLRRLTATLTNLVTLPYFFGAFQPEGRRIESPLRAPGAFGAKITVHPFPAYPIVSAFRRAKATAVGLYRIVTFWMLANCQRLFLAIGIERRRLSVISLRDFQSSKVLSQRFCVNSELLCDLTDTHLLVPVKVLEKRSQFRIKGNAALGVPIALARTISNFELPVKRGIACLLKEHLATVGTWFTWLLHLDTLFAKETSRFEHSAGVKRTEAKRDAKELYRGFRRMLFDCALDRNKYSTNELLSKGNTYGHD
jgi:hypothetical protein